jgi:hypothetical protein
MAVRRGEERCGMFFCGAGVSACTDPHRYVRTMQAGRPHHKRGESTVLLKRFVQRLELSTAGTSGFG